MPIIRHGYAEPRGTTTQRGYGHTHQTRRRHLIAMAYGTPCPICHHTMTPNQALDLDHTVPLAHDRSSAGDRITHATCNRRRGATINRGLAQT